MVRIIMDNKIKECTGKINKISTSNKNIINRKNQSKTNFRIVI